MTTCAIKSILGTSNKKIGFNIYGIKIKDWSVNNRTIHIQQNQHTWPERENSTLIIHTV